MHRTDSFYSGIALALQGVRALRSFHRELVLSNLNAEAEPAIRIGVAGFPPALRAHVLESVEGEPLEGALPEVADAFLEGLAYVLIVKAIALFVFVAGCGWALRAATGTDAYLSEAALGLGLTHVTLSLWISVCRWRLRRKGVQSASRLLRFGPLAFLVSGGLVVLGMLTL